jgi:hypothetical protein
MCAKLSRKNPSGKERYNLLDIIAQFKPEDIA